MSPDAPWLRQGLIRPDERGPWVRALLDGSLGLLVVPGVLPPAACRTLTARAERGIGIAPTRFAREFEAFSYGPCLDQSEGDLDGYLSRAPSFEDALRDALPEVVPTIERVLASLCEGMTLARPRAADGRGYALLTLRALPPGGLIPPHCENEQLPRRAYDDLRSRLDTTTLLSFYLTLDPGEAGGALAIHDLGPGAIGDRVRDGHSAIHDEVARAPAARFRFEPGTMVIFDGGRRFHQVLPVEGDRTRWTLGGFLAPSRDGERLFAWA